MILTLTWKCIQHTICWKSAVAKKFLRTLKYVKTRKLKTCDNCVKKSFFWCATLYYW